MTFMSRISTVAAAMAFAAVVASPASATTYTVIGDTTGGPTFNRPLAGDPPTGTSGVGTAVSYNTFLFSVASADTYNFLLTSTGGFDPFLVLYAGAFNPASPLTNVAIANDDFTIGNFTQSGFSRGLVTGVIYTAVITGFGNTDFGTYNLTISNTVASAVPEPVTWTMMLAGFGMVGFGMRRRGNVKTTVSYA